jgi:hypothetical protein
MSKGSNRRREDLNKIRDNWDKIFGKRDVKEEVKETKPESKQDEEKSNAK